MAWQVGDQIAIRAVIMRGGTSKAVFIKENDLPKDPELRDKVILAIYGSPDPRQIDGLGGADSLTSKLAIIGPPSRPDADVDYTFGQVSITDPKIDYSGNCGNISSAVGPYAIEEGFVRAKEPVTAVRIHNTNTKKIIEAEVPVAGGRPVTEGDFRIDGVPGTGARIVLNFLDSGGAVTGKVLPTGNVVDIIELGDGYSVEGSIVDAANPFVFVRASGLGLKGAETPEEINSRKDLLRRLEEIRSAVAEMIGLVEDRKMATKNSPAVPKIALVAKSQEYVTPEGRRIGGDEVHFVARMMSMQKAHKAYAVTGAICAAAAASITGTVVNEAASAGCGPIVRLGHPSGVIELEIAVEGQPPDIVLPKAAIARTARRLMEGCAFVGMSKTAATY